MKNVWCVENILANCDGNLYLPILHLSRVELHCKLQEKLHRVTGPLDLTGDLTLILMTSSFCILITSAAKQTLRNYLFAATF